MTPGELKAEMEKLLVARVEIHTYADPSKGTLASNVQGWANDPEVGHAEADRLMEEVLRGLGYGEAMDIYAAQTRWHA